MKRPFITLAAALAIAAAGAAFGAAAQEVEPEEQASEELTETEAGTDREHASDRFCIQQTGSRIVANRNASTQAERRECVASGGTVYTREEIERTGSTDLADALRRLDPRIF